MLIYQKNGEEDKLNILISGDLTAENVDSHTGDIVLQKVNDAITATFGTITSALEISGSSATITDNNLIVGGQASLIGSSTTTINAALTLPIIDDSTSNTLVCRDDNGQINLPKQIGEQGSTPGDEQAVSKEFVEEFTDSSYVALKSGTSEEYSNGVSVVYGGVTNGSTKINTLKQIPIAFMKDNLVLTPNTGDSADNNTRSSTDSKWNTMLGKGNKLKGSGSTANANTENLVFGGKNEINDGVQDSATFGYRNEVFANQAMTHGYKNKNYGGESFVQGTENQLLGNITIDTNSTNGYDGASSDTKASAVIGNKNVIKPGLKHSLVVGSQNTIDPGCQQIITVGLKNKIGQSCSWTNTFGDSNEIKKYATDSTVFGYDNRIYGGSSSTPVQYVYEFGRHNDNSGNGSNHSYAYMLGDYLNTTKDHQVVVGCCNTGDATEANAFFVVGTGTLGGDPFGTSNTPKTTFLVEDGNVKVNGTLTVGSTSLSEGLLQNTVETIESSSAGQLKYTNIAGTTTTVNINGWDNKIGSLTAGSFITITGSGDSRTIAATGLGDIVTHSVAEFATAAQGGKADSALQPGAAVGSITTSTINGNISVLMTGASTPTEVAIHGLDTAAYKNIDYFLAAGATAVNASSLGGHSPAYYAQASSISDATITIVQSGVEQTFTLNGGATTITLTDTTYSTATTLAEGLMSADDKGKLDSLYVIPATTTPNQVLKSTGTARVVEWSEDSNTNTWRPVEVDGTEQLDNSTTLALNFKSQDTNNGDVSFTYDSVIKAIKATAKMPTLATTTADGLMSKDDKIKLNEITVTNNSGTKSVTDGTSTLTFGSNAFTSTTIVKYRAGAGIAFEAHPSHDNDYYIKLDGTYIDGTLGIDDNKLATQSTVATSVGGRISNITESDINGQIRFTKDGSNYTEVAVHGLGSNAFNSTTIPTEYIKSASRDGNTLTLTKQNDDTVVYTPSFTDTNYYHTTGTWSGFTYTAAANGGAPTLAFTLPTGTGANQVAVGNHNHDGSYVSKVTAGNSARLYGVNASNEQAMYTIGTSEDNIVQRTTNGQIVLPDQSTYAPGDDNAISKRWVVAQNYTSNTGTVIGSSLTANKLILGNSGVNIKSSAYKPGPSSITWSTTDDEYLPTMKAISSYVTGIGYTKDTYTAGLGITLESHPSHSHEYSISLNENCIDGDLDSSNNKLVTQSTVDSAFQRLPYTTGDQYYLANACPNSNSYKIGIQWIPNNTAGGDRFSIEFSKYYSNGIYGLKLSGEGETIRTAIQNGQFSCFAMNTARANRPGDNFFVSLFSSIKHQGDDYILALYYIDNSGSMHPYTEWQQYADMYTQSLTFYPANKVPSNN